MTVNGMHETKLPEYTMCGRILVVDDEPSILKAITAILSDEGCSVKVCGDAESGLMLVGQESFDVIISDIRMPGMSGIDFLAYLHHKYPLKPVILISGYADLETAVSAVKERAFDFIMKPFHPEHIIGAVRKALEHKRLIDIEQEYRELLESTLARSAVEVRQYLQQLKEARDEALEASRLKSQFMAAVSHEIRTPLNGIVGLIDILSYKEQLPHQAEYFAMMKEAADNLTALLGNLLDFSRYAGGRPTISEKPFILWHHLESVCGMVRIRAEKKGISFSLDIDDEVPNEVVGDEARLSQVLLNLLDNALKFTRKGSIHVRISSADGQPADAGSQICLKIVVDDTGVGIDPERQEIIFDSFTQADGSLTKQNNGAGLGLAIAKQIVTAMGGEIGVKSSPGLGSSFYFTAKMHRGGRA